MNYSNTYFNKEVEMQEKIPGKNQVKNLANGYAFKANNFTALRRWLLTGSLTNSFYQSSTEMTELNINLLKECVLNNPKRTAEEILNASKTGTMASQHTAILALVYLSMGDYLAKNEFRNIFPLIIRTASHLYEFMSYVKELRGFGQLIHNTIKNWFKDHTLKDIEYQFLKYQNRYGWTGRDVLRMIKPKPTNEKEKYLFNWIAGGSEKNPLLPIHNKLERITVYENLKSNNLEEKQIIKLINDYNLTQEMIPANIERTPAIWEALFNKMPITATLRNLGNLTSKGIFTIENIDILEKRFIKENIKKAYLHPITIANAYQTYSQGFGFKGKLFWKPISRIQDILEESIQNAFETLEPTNKHFFHALDISSSMYFNKNVSGFQLNPMEIAGIMALATLKTEKNYFIGGFSNHFIELNNLRKNTSYREIINGDHIKGINFGGTNAASAYQYAIDNKINTDVFIFWTDSESWVGNHPAQKLKEYRKKINSEVKAIYITLLPYGDFITLVDPDDNNSYDIGGFSSDTPKIINMITKGEF